MMPAHTLPTAARAATDYAATRLSQTNAKPAAAVAQNADLQTTHATRSAGNARMRRIHVPRSRGPELPALSERDEETLHEVRQRVRRQIPRASQVARTASNKPRMPPPPPDWQLATASAPGGVATPQILPQTVASTSAPLAALGGGTQSVLPTSTFGACTVSTCAQLPADAAPCATSAPGMHMPPQAVVVPPAQASTDGTPAWRATHGCAGVATPVTEPRSMCDQTHACLMASLVSASVPRNPQCSGSISATGRRPVRACTSEPTCPLNAQQAGARCLPCSAAHSSEPNNRFHAEMVTRLSELVQSTESSLCSSVGHSGSSAASPASTLFQDAQSSELA